MPKPPKVAAPLPMASTPTSASFISSSGRGSGALSFGMSNRPINPAIGSSKTFIGRPSLLGGA